MVLDEVWFQQRLAELEEQRTAALKQLTAVDGAIQFCRYTLQEMNKDPEAGEGSPASEGDGNADS